MTYEGAKKRYGEITDEIRERLDFELATIKNTGYPGYFLIVQDFTNEAQKLGVSVGPGEGPQRVQLCLLYRDYKCRSD